MKNVDTEKIQKSLRTVARNIFWFHLMWIIMVLLGTIAECFYHPYAKIQLGIIIGTGLFQLLGNGHCPLTLFENLTLQQSAPEKMYCDPITYEASFVRYVLKKFFKFNAPKGTTTALLIIALVTTIVILILY